MAYKKFIKRGGKIFGPYYYKSYRDKKGVVKKIYLGTVDPDEGKKNGRGFNRIFSFLNSSQKKVAPTKNNLFNKVFLIPFIILLTVVFIATIYNPINSGVRVGESFEGVKDFVSSSFFKIAGFTVSDVDESEVTEEVVEEDLGGGEEVVEEVTLEIEEVGGTVEESGVELGDEEVAEEIVDSDELVEGEGTGETLIDETSGELNETIIESPIGQDPTGSENETILDEIIINETIELNETLVNKTIEINESIELNETVIEENETILDEIIINETIELNETLVNKTIEINETIIADAVESLTTLQYKAIIHRPVKWMKKVNVSIADNLTIEIPKLAENVSVLTDEEIVEAEKEIEDYESLVNEADKEKIVFGFLTGDVVKDINSGKGFFTRLWDWILSFSISGNVVLESELNEEGMISETNESRIVDVEKIVNDTDAENVGVEYYTPAPFVVEQNISGGKLVTVSADDVYNYTDVLAYSLVDGMGVPINSSVGLRIYWRASYEDAVRYGYIEEDVSKKDLKKEEKEKAPKEDDSNESKEKKEKDEFVENETVEEVNESVELNETILEEIIINETVELNESDGKVKDEKEKEKDNKTSGNDNAPIGHDPAGPEKKSLITGEVVKDVGEEELVVESNEIVASYVRVEVNFSVHDLDGDGLVDYVEWIVPHLSNQTYEISIEILNVQSYPTVGGNWTVGFNTTGEANLTVSAFNGTTSGFEYSNESLVYDLEFLEMRCGDEVLNVSVIMNETVVPYEIYLKKKRIEEIREEEYNISNLTQELVDVNYSWLVNYTGNVSSVSYENYSCVSTGYHIVKVLTEGVHNQLFEFGWMNASAHNLATAGGTTKTTHTTKVDFDSGSYLNGSYANGTTSTSVDGNLKMVIYGEPSDLDASMVLWMHMNNDSVYGENDTLVYDHSGRGHHGNCVGASCPVFNNTGGKFGGAFDYSPGGAGDDTYFVINDSDDFDFLNFSLEAWLKVASGAMPDDYYYIVKYDPSNPDDRFYIGVLDDVGNVGHPSLFIGVGGTTTEVFGNSDLRDEQWHHVVGVRNSTHISIWVDGVFHNATPDNTPGQLIDADVNLSIGDAYLRTTEGMDGTIDEVAIYNRSLSASEIHALYMAGNETHPNVNTTNWTSPILDSGEVAPNWTTIEWDAVQSDRANVSRASELVYDPNMVLWMHMNNDSAYGENDTLVYDFSGNGNNGTFVGDISWNSTGKFGGAYEFDNITTCLNVSSSTSLDDLPALTFSAWMYPYSSGYLGRGMFFRKHESGIGNHYFALKGNTIEYNVNYVTQDLFVQTGADAYIFNAWQFVTVTWNGSLNASDSVHIYIDGVEDTSRNTVEDGIGDRLTDANADLYLGCRLDIDGYFDGLLDEVAIYNRSLSAEEIRNMYYEDVVKFQTRTASTSGGISSASWSDFLPIDGTSQTIMSSDLQFLQYRAVFTSNSTETPILEEVNVTYTLIPFEGDQAGEFAQLSIWDDSDDVTVYSNYTKFYANYTNATSGVSINGTGVYCTWWNNKTGSWVDAINMTFNATSKLYELVADGGYLAGHRDGMPVGNYSFNVSCFNNFNYTNLTVADSVNVSEYATSINIENDTSKSVGEQVMFYANYSADSMLISGVGLNGSEIGRVIWNTSDLGILGAIDFIDLDNDGKLDEVVAGDVDVGKLIYFYGNGTNFQNSTTFGDRNDYSIKDLSIFDGDNNSYLDNVGIGAYIDYHVFHVYVFNKTAGTFFDSGDISDTEGPSVSDFGDLDGDGKENDLVVTILDEVYAYFYNGTDWVQNWTATAAEIIIEIKTFDVDNDGVDEVLIGTSAEDAYLYDNDGTNLWNKTDFGSDIESIAIGDFDNDGLENDFALGSFGKVLVYNSSFDNVWNISANRGVKEMWSTDIDHDGYKDDIIISDEGNIRVYNINASSATSYWSYGSNVNDKKTFSLSVNDINDDGEKEIVFTDEDTDGIFVLNSTGSLIWDYNLNLGDIGDEYGSHSGINIGDINNDGINDIAVASKGGYAHVLQDVTCKIQFEDEGGEINASVESGLVGLWHMNNDSDYGENDTLVYDHSGRGHHGNCVGASCPVFNNTGGKFGGAFDYSPGGAGDDTYFVINDSDDFDFLNFSLEAWLKVASGAMPDDYYYIVKYDPSNPDDRFYIGVLDDVGNVGHPSLFIGVGGTTTEVFGNSDLRDEQWHHVVGVRNSTHISIWVDGVFHNATPDNTPGQLIDADVNLSIGDAYLRTTEGMDGTIDEVAIYNRSLSASEIRDLYLAQASEHDMDWNSTSNKWEYNRTFSSAASSNYGVACEKGGYVEQVSLSTLSVSAFNISHSPSLPYANYTRVIADFDDSGANCSLKFNKTGSWSSWYNMSWNATLGGFNVVADNGYICNSTECHMRGMPVGNYSYNVTCDNVLGEEISAVNSISVQEYATSLSIENETAKSVGEQVMFYANYSADSMLISGVGLNGSEIGRVIWNTTDVGGSTYSIAFFDCENKGKKDCIALGEDGDVFAYYSNGTEKWHSTAPDNIIYEIGVFDGDNDGYENMLTLADYSGYTSVLNESGDEVWTNGVDLYLFGSVAVGDLDNDGLKDDFVLSGRSSASDSSVYVWNTSDGVTWHNQWNITNTGNNIAIVVDIGDLDRDGFEDDVVICGRGSDGDSDFKAYNERGDNIWNSPNDRYPDSLAVGDLDHDGYRDEVVALGYSYMWAYKWNGTYGATPEILWTFNLDPNAYGGKVAVGDLDNDGWSDDIVYGKTGIYAVNNDSTPLWSSSISSSTINSIVIKDINDDGEVEVIIGGDDDILWVFNRTGYLLWSYTIGLGDIGYDNGEINYGKNPAIDTSDINNDGINDIAVASSQGYAHILQDVTCKAYFNDSNSYNMTWNSTINKWELNRTFGAAGDYDWNVSCEKGGYVSTIESLTVNVLPDTTPPTYSLNQTNNTNIFESTLFSIYYNDNSGLEPTGQYIFSTNNTGVWINESAVNFTATPSWANVIKTLSSTGGVSVGYRWYADDNEGNVNNTEVFSLITTDTTYPQLDFISPTPANDTTVTTASIEMNVSITEADLDEVKWNWDGTNYTLMNDSLVLMMNFDNVSAWWDNYNVFPTTGILDDFDRGNEDLDVSGSWSQVSNADDLEVISNVVGATSFAPYGYASCYWDDNTFQDVEAYFTLSTKQADENHVILVVRSTTTDITTVDGYALFVSADPGTDAVTLDRIENGASVEELARFNGEFASGWKFGVSMVGNLITAWYDSGSGWTKFGSATDSTYQDAGYTAIAISDTTVRINDLGGGEPLSNVVDVSGYGNDGSVVGDISWNSSGKYGGAFEFDNFTTCINISSPASLDDLPALTFTSWMYAYSSGSYTRGSFFRKENPPGDGNHYFSLWGTQLEYNVNYADQDLYVRTGEDAYSFNTWHFVAVTWNGSLNASDSVHIYVDGVEVTSRNAADDGIGERSTDADADLYLGCRSDIDGYFDGLIDEVRIWNESFSAEEISQMYMSNLNKYDTDKWLLYVNQSKNATDGLDDGTYTYFASAKDESGNENVTETRSVMVDATVPTYSGTQENNTEAGQSTLFSIRYDDTIALHPKGQYIFSTNNTGVWTNDSAVNFTATPNWANITKTLNSTVGISIGYRWYAYDNAGNWGNTIIFKVVTTDTIFPKINFTSPTLDNGSTTSNTSIEMNVSIIEENLEEVKWNWNGTNYTLFNDSLVLMMNFDNVSVLGENNSYVVDVSGEGNDGTTSGDPVMNMSGGKFAGAFEFDGDDDYIEITDFMNVAPTTEITISVWVYTNDGDDGSIFRSELTGTNQRINVQLASGVLYWDFGSSDADGRLSYTPPGGFKYETWEHFCFVSSDSGSYQRIYRNGVLEASDATATYLNQYSGYLGITSPLANYEFNGSIDEVRIYNRSLSAEEISQMYMSNLNKYDTDKWLLYVNQSKNATAGLDDGTYTYFASAKDETGNENVTEVRSVTISTTGNTVPVVNSSRISSDSNTTVDDLLGYCNATDTDGDNVTYYYRWFKSDVLNLSGNTAVNYTQGIETNVNNMTSGNLSIGDGWILSCLANDGTDNSSWVNSSEVTILEAFKFKITTTGSPQTFSFQTDNALNLFVDWGDGNNNTYNGTGLRSHQFATAGDYNISLTGYVNRVSFYEGTEDLLNDILTPMSNSLTGINNSYQMFRSASGITTFTAEDWFDDVSGGVTNMNWMFFEALNFNQPLNNWNTSSVTGMDYIFYHASAFNGNISNWDTSSVIDMAGMFESASDFNQPLNNWNTSSVTDMSYMFYYATDFNQPLNNWNTSSVIDMAGMFASANAFNGNISNWDTSSVTDMLVMFFEALNFNQPLNNWNTSSVTDMYGVFGYAPAFNQPLNNWNTSKVTNMDGMFYSATSFNQNLSSWNVSVVTDMTDMFYGVTLSTANYDSLLIGWAGLTPNLQSSVPFHGGYSKYSSAAVSARNTTLIGVHNWTITDGGINNSLPMVTLVLPEDNNLTTDRTPTFTWDGYDADGDTMTYEINITTHPTGSEDDRYVQGIGVESYTPSTDLKYLSDNNYWYTWKVRANDSEGYGEWSEERKINISALLTISLPVDVINFGSISMLSSNDTTDNSPASLVIQNDGNCRVNVSANASQLWATEAAASDKYRFKIDNKSGEEGAFDWLTSLTSWTNMPITSAVIGVSGLNYSDSVDSAEVDVYIEVPANEPPATRSSTIIFTSSLDE